jgi:hypothetical protein
VRTVRVEPFGPSVLRVLHVFLNAFVSIRLASGFWWEGVWWTVRLDVHELLADRPRTWYGPSTCRGAVWVVLFVFNGQSAVGRGPSTW